MVGKKGFFRRFRDRTGSSLGVIIAAALLLEGLAVMEHFYTRNMLQEELEKRSEVLLRRSDGLIRHTLDLAEQTMRDHVWDIQDGLDSPENQLEAVRHLLDGNRQIVGACLSFLPGYYSGRPVLFEPYASRSGADIRVEDLAADGHDYTLHPAYQFAVREGKALWSDPYKYGEDKQADLITYTYPIRDRSGRVVAACGLDIDLSWLGDTLNTHRFYPSSFVLALTREGKLVAGPSMETVAPKEVERIVALVNDPTAVRSRRGAFPRRAFHDGHRNRDASLWIHSLPEVPYWQIVSVNFDDEIYAPARRLRLNNFLIALAGLLVLLFIVLRYVRNARRLSAAEVREARIGSELHVARKIQMEMVPKTWPPFPERRDVDIYGSLEPAREVGGDLFDFFIRDEKLFFCIGDVSGKGVPSAMVMTMVRSLFRAFSERMADPARIMDSLNAELCRGNESTMFVTFFLGVLDLPTGRLRYCNAGHDHPVLLGKQAVLLDAKANLPLGVFADTRFEAQEGRMDPGTTIFLYTDGLTEAKNERRELFTRQRMLETCAGASDCRTLLEQVGKAVRDFMGTAGQADDLTMLAIRYTPENEEVVLSESLTLPADVSRIGELGDFVKSIATRLGLTGKPAHDLRLAVEEIVVNVMSYAFPDGKEGEVRVDAYADRKAVRFIITDDGIPFDPTEVEMADTTLSVEERPIGGLGIFLARGLMDSINYEYADGRNILTLKKMLNTSTNG